MDIPIPPSATFGGGMGHRTDMNPSPIQKTGGPFGSARLLQIVGVGLLERCHGRVNFSIDLKEGLETNRVEHVLYLFAGVE